jgi:hypothetical protein
MKCSECGAVWLDGNMCQNYFYQMLFWENENPGYGEVHHLMVLGYYLQHPDYLSSEGLQEAIKLLQEFLECGITPLQVRKSRRADVNSGKRTWKIKATKGSKGTYGRPIKWGMRAEDVVVGGREEYCKNVRRWAASIYEILKDTGNLSDLSNSR